MEDFCIFEIKGLFRSWRQDVPAFLSFLFDEDSFYIKTISKARAYKKVGYATTCIEALERLNRSGINWEMLEKVYDLYYDDLYKDFELELDYHIGPYVNWEDTIQESYVEDLLRPLSNLSRLDQLKDFSSFYVPMLLADAGKESFMVKSIDGRVYEIKKRERGYEKGEHVLERFSLDRYIGLPPWILLIARLFLNRSNWNLDEAISAMDIKFLLEWHPPETNIDLNLSGIVNSGYEIERLHDRLARRLINKVNLYNYFLGSVIKNDMAVRNIHLSIQVKGILRRIEDREVSNDSKRKVLEELMNLVFSAVNGFNVTESRLSLGDEEIDLLLKNNINRPFWISFNSPFIFVECKNWSKKVGAREIRDFEGKLRNHGVIVKIGFFISYNGFSSEVKTAIQRISSSDNHIVLISGKDLKVLAESNIEVLDWLEDLVTKIY